MNTAPVSLYLEHVSLDYPLNKQVGSSFKQEIFKSVIGGSLRKSFTSNKHQQLLVSALSDVSLELSLGDCLHIKGHNGAGKSSLLKLMAGIYQPSTGIIRRHGKVMTILGLSAGALMKCTGIENIIRILMLHGLTKKEAESHIPYVAEFSELDSFLHLPINTYSSGMLVRLMFSIATCRKPEILIIDEIIGAGDALFSLKSQERIKELIAVSSITVLATHSECFASEICNHTLTLDKGLIVDYT